MAGNTFGQIFRLSTYGESHGEAIGGSVDGCPAGIEIDIEKIQTALDRRRPGQSAITTQRKEKDRVRILSGVWEGKTTGTPIGFVIENQDQKSKDYDHIKHQYRPSHADYTYDQKYGFRDYRGGGRSSARETAARVVGGAIAQQVIPSVSIQAYVSSVGSIELKKNYNDMDLALTETNPVRCPDPAVADEMEQLIRKVRKQGDTIGGVVTCVIKNVRVGLGEPVFDKLHADLGKAMMSINAVKGFEYGSGFAGTTMLGSEHNDVFNADYTTQTNHSGGIQGGISNGEDIYFRVAFKPVATLIRPQTSVDSAGNAITIEGKGRHDPCVLPRAVPIVEAMAALTIADFELMQRTRDNK